MTNDILRTDIELATRLLDDKRPDDQIITALAQRGIDPAKAAQLVDDLRNGRAVSTKPGLPTEFGPMRRSRSRRASREASQDQSSSSSKVESPSKPTRRAASHHHKKPAISWLVPALVVVLVAVVGGIVVFKRHGADADSAAGRRPGAPTAKVDGASTRTPATAAAPGKHPATAPLVLDLQPDGLHIGASRVTAGNVLTAVANSLGAATRTNRVAKTDTVIYAYDRQGLLIYSQKAGGTNSIMLDCEASGSTYGTLSPFTGTLTVEGQVIRTDTDRQSLTAIKQLDLSRKDDDNSIWGGRYHELQLVFTYLKSPQHLSLIEIDLK